MAAHELIRTCLIEIIPDGLILLTEQHRMMYACMTKPDHANTGIEIRNPIFRRYCCWFIHGLHSGYLSPTDGGIDNSRLLEPLDDIIVSIALAALAMCQPIDMYRQCVKFARNSSVHLPVLGGKVKFKRWNHTYYAKKWVSNQLECPFLTLPLTLYPTYNELYRNIWCKYRTISYKKNILENFL